MKMTGHDRQADAGSAEFGGIAHDQDQFAQAFEDCRPDLLRVCRRILGEPDSAQDAVNETYLRAYGKLAQFESGNFPGWLSRIAKRICLDRIRREFPLQRGDAETELGSTDSEVRILTAIQIRSILATLPEPQRRCLKLFYIEGFTAKEVARETRFTEKQVKSHLQNGRRNFLLAWNAMESKGDE